MTEDSLKQLRSWAVCTVALGATMAGAALVLGRSGQQSVFEREGLELVVMAGAALCGLGIVGWFLGRTVSPLLSAEPPDDRPPQWCTRRPYLTLFLASFVALFIEVMLIRYCGSQLRIFSFYKNVPLVAAFLGLGLGCWKGGGRSRHVIGFLLWLIPLTAFLAHGSRLVDGVLGKLAASSSSEHILGDVVAAPTSAAAELMGQVLMGVFCVVILASITALFTLLGRFLGDAFEATPRLPGYTVNILASLAGVVGFGVLAVLWTPPWLWYAFGLLPLLWWVGRPAARIAAVSLMAVNCIAVVPDHGEVVWSPYQKLTGHEIPAGAEGTGTASTAYLVQISDVFYQVAMDLRPENVARMGRHPYPHYDHAFSGLQRLDRVLVVGSGTGNDVAAALRAGARHVDAVDIDPAIVDMGRRHHPERPYDDPRVHVVVDDARKAFRYLPKGSYDAVVFGLLDSHTQLGISSVRLDNYVFTMESLTSARELLRPGGAFIVTAATFRDWFRDRFVAMLSETCQQPVEVRAFGAWHTYRCQVAEAGASQVPATEVVVDLPTDDWPFLYLPRREVPTAYLVVVAMLAIASVGVLRVGGLRLGSFTPFHGHLFFLGSAFLLMEMAAINRLALLFGTTWIVSAVTISIVLTLIVAANMITLSLGSGSYGVSYGALFAVLTASYFVDPEIVLGRGPGLAVVYGLGVLLPVFFAGLVFARSFSGVKLAGAAIGANILGSVLGGWIEYATMAVGVRNMVVVAMALYLLSLLMLMKSKRTSDEPKPQ